MRDDVQQVVDELLDDLDGQGELDLIEAFAFPLPAIVIAKMLGVPPEDRHLFKSWSDDLIALLFGAVDVPDRHDRALVGMLELTSYLHGLIEKARTEPGDDLITALVRAEEGDDALTLDEVVATCVLLLFGGHETTTNLIGNGMLALLRNPDQMAALQGDLSLAADAVEETLRYDGPAKVSVRTVHDDLEVHGHQLRAGDRLFLVPAAANRDPRQYPDPDRFDIRREDKVHIGFGIGIHFCLGASLARLEGELALRALVERFPAARLATEDLAWHPTLLSRGVTSLPLLVDGA
jgi:cytochrome P450